MIKMKPISKTIEETKEKIVRAINESELPMSIIEMILKDLHLQSEQLAKKELDEINETLKKEAEEKKEEKK